MLANPPLNIPFNTPQYRNRCIVVVGGGGSGSGSNRGVSSDLLLRMTISAMNLLFHMFNHGM